MHEWCKMGSVRDIVTYDGIYSRSKLVNKLKATYCDVCVCGTYVHVVHAMPRRAGPRRDLTSLTT